MARNYNRYGSCGSDKIKYYKIRHQTFTPLKSFHSLLSNTKSSHTKSQPICRRMLNVHTFLANDNGAIIMSLVQQISHTNHLLSCY